MNNEKKIKENKNKTSKKNRVNNLTKVAGLCFTFISPVKNT